MASSPLTWLEAKQDPRANQLVKIGAALTASFGVTPDDIAYWNKGAAVNDYLQSALIPAIRDFAPASTAARDELQIDKTIVPFALPAFVPPPMPPLVQSAVEEMARAQSGASHAGDVPLRTDFLEWCDTLYKKMRLNGLSDSLAQNLGFLVPPAPVAATPSDLKPRILSLDTQPAGETRVTTSRDDQKMVHVQITLDTGAVLDKTLPNTRFVFMLPTDRAHSLEARARYADKDGNDIGQWSDIKTDSSEV